VEGDWVDGPCMQLQGLSPLFCNPHRRFALLNMFYTFHCFCLICMKCCIYTVYSSKRPIGITVRKTNTQEHTLCMYRFLALKCSELGTQACPRTCKLSLDWLGMSRYISIVSLLAFCYQATGLFFFYEVS
jgi:hypothetical protein